MAASLEQSGIAGFFAHRWRGETPLGVLFWRDMLVVATLVSLSTTLVALGLLAAGIPLPVVLFVQFCPLPYNAFLFACVWKHSGAAGGISAHLMPLVAAVWLVVATIV